MAFSTARTVTPTSANTAIHMVARPGIASNRTNILIPMASQMFSFAVTPEILAQLTKIDTWGNAFIINGDGNIEITRISLIQFGAVEEKTAIWEGSQVVDWSGGAGEDNKAMTALSWGGYDWSTVEAGTKIVLEFTPTAEEVQIRFSNGSWAAHPGTPDPYKLYGESSLEI